VSWCECSLKQCRGELLPPEASEFAGGDLDGPRAVLPGHVLPGEQVVADRGNYLAIEVPE
jgi:hypothetical protein